MSTYLTSKTQIDNIATKYAQKGNIIVRTSIQYLLEYGKDRFNNDSFISSQIQLINDKHDRAEKDNRFLIMSRNLEISLVKCAAELAKINTYDLIIYMQKELYWSDEGGVDYGRAVELLKNCMDWMCQQETNDSTLYEVFESCDFFDSELESLGYEYLCKVFG